MRKKLRVVSIAGMLLCSLLISGCTKKEETAVKKESLWITEADTVFLRAGEAAIERKIKEGRKGTISVATLGSHNIEILNEAARLLALKGYCLEIEACDDYLIPNELVAAGKVDCNYYQHSSFLERYNIRYGTTLQEMAKIHFEPMAVYGGRIETLSQVETGMKVGLPKNPTALAQALHLLQAEGLLVLQEDADLTAEMEDILENPWKLQWILMDEEEIVQQLDQLDLGVFRTSYALKQGLDLQKEKLAVEKEASLTARNLAQGVVVQDSSNEMAAVLAETLRSKEMKQFIESRYHGSICMMEEESR